MGTDKVMLCDLIIKDSEGNEVQSILDSPDPCSEPTIPYGCTYTLNNIRTVDGYTYLGYRIVPASRYTYEGPDLSHTPLYTGGEIEGIATYDVQILLYFDKE